MRPKYNYTITGSTTVTDLTPGEGTDLQGCFISPDGTKLYIAYWSNKRLYQYNLSTPRNISTASVVRYAGVTAPDGFSFSNDGKYLFVGDETDHTIKRYTLSTNWDISTMTLDQSLSISNNYATEVCIAENGEHIYYTRYNGSKFVFRSYDLSIPYELTTATNLKTYNETSFSQCVGIAVRNSGETLYVSDEHTNIVQFTLATPYDITSTKTEIGRYTLTGSNEGRCLYVSPDMKYWTFGIGSKGVSIREFEAVKI